MLLDEIKVRLKAAIKEQRVVEREILRVALGDIQTRDLKSDEEIQALLKKLLKSNEETLGLTDREEEKVKLGQENEVLRSLLPQSLSEAQIIEALGPVAEAIAAAQNDGQATGIAMKQLKQLGAEVSGKTVAAAVKTLRS